MQHLPYVDEMDSVVMNQSKLRKNVLRTVAVVAARFIEDGEELYADYYDSSRVPVGYTADWLVRPPPLSPYLQKKELLTPIPKIAKLAMKYRAEQLGEAFDAWEQRSTRELPSSEGNFIFIYTYSQKKKSSE